MRVDAMPKPQDVWVTDAMVEAAWRVIHKDMACDCRECVRKALIAALARSNAERELSNIALAIGSNRFLDPPDGGDVSLAEQVKRMREALETAEAQSSAEPRNQISRIINRLRFCEDALRNGVPEEYFGWAGDQPSLGELAQFDAELILDSISEALESRGYVHMTNGKSIGDLLDELEALRTQLDAKPDAMADKEAYEEARRELPYPAADAEPVAWKPDANMRAELDRSEMVARAMLKGIMEQIDYIEAEGHIEWHKRIHVNGELYLPDISAAVLASLYTVPPRPDASAGLIEADLEPIERLIEQCETDYESHATKNEADTASVGWDKRGPLPMTFGHVRGARKAINKLRARAADRSGHDASAGLIEAAELAEKEAEAELVGSFVLRDFAKKLRARAADRSGK